MVYQNRILAYFSDVAEVSSPVFALNCVLLTKTI